MEFFATKAEEQSAAAVDTPTISDHQPEISNAPVSPLLHYVSPGLFAGTTAGNWWRLLNENRFSIDSPYWLRAAIISGSSLGNSFLSIVEKTIYRKKIQKTQIQSPIFILGSWRNGTTHLHNLLSLDSRFATPNLYQSLFPQTFLCTEWLVAQILNTFTPRKRPMDGVRLGMQEPAEDELAMCVATQCSNFLGQAFYQNASHYERFLTLHHISQQELDRWKFGFNQFLQKLTLRYQRRLFLKSPEHTGKVRLLLEMFPDAKFIHIRRNPYDVFQSMLRMIPRLSKLWSLQRPQLENIEEHALRQYRLLYDAFFEDKHLIPSDHLCEIDFDDLESDPIEQLAHLYQSLDLADFSEAEPCIRSYIETLSDYQRNNFTELSHHQISQINSEWSRCFEEWDYPVR